MRQSLKNETDMLESINKIQALLTLIDKKVDTLIAPSLPAKHNDHNNTRVMHKAICADCKKECSIPFKPSGDRPVYCQDCFSRRKVIKLSGIKVDEKPQVNILQAAPKAKKKAATVKKAVTKKKPTPKRK